MCGVGMVGGVLVCMCMFVPVWLGFRHGVSFEKLKSYYNQTWVKDPIEVPLYIIEVKGHVEFF